MPETLSLKIGALDPASGTVAVTIADTVHAVTLPLDGAYAPLRGAALRDELIDQAIAAYHAQRARAARGDSANQTIASAELAALTATIDATANYATYCQSMTIRPDRTGRSFKMRVVDASKRTSR